MIDLFQLFKDIRHIDRLMEGWTDGVRREYTICYRAKMEIIDEYSIVQAFIN